MPKISVKHTPHPAYTSAMASGISLSGPSPDGFVHMSFWREGLRLVEESFMQELFEQNGIQVAKMKPDGSSTEHFREDVATIVVPVPKFDEFCEAMCKMRDGIKLAIDARDAAIAQDTTAP